MIDTLEEKEILSLYAKKTVTARWAQRTVEFEIPTTGFSSFQLDHGTLRLLRQVEAEHPHWSRALDLGCGYGPIAINLSVTGIVDQVMGIDRDALAVEFAQRNAEKNKVTNGQFRGGLGYHNLPMGEKFDAVLSNIPAKAGDPVHHAMLLDAGHYLNPNGRVAIVVVTPLEERIDAILARDEIELQKKIPFTDHIVYIYSFRNILPPTPWPYTRNELTLSWKDISYPMQTAFGLPEFDSLSWGTDLVLDVLAKKKNRLRFGNVMVWNPGQGHLPVLLGRMAGRIDRMTLISRDALALHQSAVNVAKNECCSEVHQEHRVGFTSGTGEKNVDLCVGMINDKEGLEINVKKITQVRNIYGNVPLFLGTPISFGLRLEKALRKEKIKALMVKKHQGNGVLECE